MMQWQNGFWGVSKAAALGWARGPGKGSERRSRLKAICPHAMRSFWKLAALRLTESTRILSGRRALRCFHNELHHFYHFRSEVVLEVVVQVEILHFHRLANALIPVIQREAHAIVGPIRQRFMDCVRVKDDHVSQTHITGHPL